MLRKWLPFLCAFFAAFPAHALTLDYAVYASGFRVVDVHSVITESKDKYALTLDAGLHGWLSHLAPWSGSVATDGTGFAPRSHRFSSTWDEETEVTTFTYGAKGYKGGTIIKADGSKQDLPPSPELTDGTVDVLSALHLSMLAAAKNGGKCDLKAKVFDGRRSFWMAYKDAGAVTMKKSDYSTFAGPARKCIVEITPIAGKWSAKPRGWLSVQEQSRLKGQLPTLYFARVQDNFPPVPVRAEIKTRYGAAILHLTDVAN